MSEFSRLIESEDGSISEESTIPEYFPSIRAFVAHDMPQDQTIPTDSLISFCPDLEISEIPPVTPISTTEFIQVVEDVREAISLGIHPLLISKGSSGSYFCRNKFGEIVGVFKPKDEEPYGNLQY